jgi:shikimate dehydrogenase
MKKLVGLLGHPLGHTLSPLMHNAAYKKIGLNDYEYLPLDVAPQKLAEAVAGLRAGRVLGFNVTIPHKETIIPLLDEVTELARKIGAVNTVKNQAGRLIGYNTDGPGFLETLKNEGVFDPRRKKAVVLGAGGASRAVSTMLAESGIAELTITDAVKARAEQLANQLALSFDLECQAVELSSPLLLHSIEEADLLVNTSPVGMSPQIENSPLPTKTNLSSRTLVYDLVYNPGETKLLQEAKKAGCKTVSGLGMLVRQGALAFTIFTGEEAPLETMLQAAKKGLAAQA